MAYSDQEIIAGLRKGEDWAYSEIFKQYYEGMCVLANTILQDRFLAEATAQDVISHLYEVRENVQIRSNLRSYLLTSVRNTCLNAIGTKQTRSEHTFSALSKDDTQDYFSGVETLTPHGILLDKELRTRVMDFIDKLPEPIRTTFIRSRFDGKSYREIGNEQGVSANTIKVRIKKVMQQMEEHFNIYCKSITIALPLISLNLFC